MPLGCAVAIFTVFTGLIIWGLIVRTSMGIPLSWVGRNHCGIVTFNGSGGDIHFDEMSPAEITKRLKDDYRVFHRWESPDKRLAEYRIFTNTRGHVKTIGYITKDRVVFEGKTYFFPEED